MYEHIRAFYAGGKLFNNDAIILQADVMWMHEDIRALDKRTTTPDVK